MRGVNSESPRIIAIQTDVPESWPGWRFTTAGRFFVTPDGEHLTPERIRGLAWRDAMELRRAGFASRRKAEKAGLRGLTVKVVVVQLSDWQERHFGTRAG